jgi:hypothetical protein
MQSVGDGDVTDARPVCGRVRGGAHACDGGRRGRQKTAAGKRFRDARARAGRRRWHACARCHSTAARRPAKARLRADVGPARTAGRGGWAWEGAGGCGIAQLAQGKADAPLFSLVENVSVRRVWRGRPTAVCFFFPSFRPSPRPSTHTRSAELVTQNTHSPPAIPSQPSLLSPPPPTHPILPQAPASAWAKTATASSSPRQSLGKDGDGEEADERHAARPGLGPGPRQAVARHVDRALDVLGQQGQGGGRAQGQARTRARAAGRDERGRRDGRGRAAKRGGRGRPAGRALGQVAPGQQALAQDEDAKGKGLLGDGQGGGRVEGGLRVFFLWIGGWFWWRV